MISMMGRMSNTGHPIHTTSLSAMSPFSGPLDRESYAPSIAHERVRRNRKSRKTSSPGGESSNNFPASGECLSRTNVARRSGPSHHGRPVSSSPNSGSQSLGRLGAYAGAKFGDAPSPRLLPLPPQHWLRSGNLQSTILSPCQSLTSEIKTLLQVV